MENLEPVLNTVDLINNKLVCMSGESSIVFLIDIRNGKIIKKIRLKDEDLLLNNICIMNTAKFENNVVFIPYYGKKLHFLDISRYVDDVTEMPSGLENCRYYGNIIYKGKCYALPYDGNTILEIDVEKKKVSEYMKIEERKVEFDSLYTLGEIVEYKEKYYFMTLNEGFFIELDLKNLNVRKIVIEGIEKGVKTVCRRKNKLYLNLKRKISVYNIESDAIEAEVELNVADADAYCFSLSIGEKVFFFEKMGDSVIEFNVESGMVSQYRFCEWLKCENIKYVFIGKISEDKILLMSDESKFLIFDLSNESVKIINLRLVDFYNDMEIEEYIVSSVDVIRESRMIKLSNYMNCLGR